MTFPLEIVTPEGISYTDHVDMVSVPSVLGTLGILPRHIPLFAQLTHGELKIKKGNDEIFLAIGGGFVEVTFEKVMVLVTRALHYKELNEQEILRAQSDAKDALKQKPEGKEYQSLQGALRQSIVDLQILRRRKKLH